MSSYSERMGQWVTAGLLTVSAVGVVVGGYLNHKAGQVLTYEASQDAFFTKLELTLKLLSKKSIHDEEQREQLLLDAFKDGILKPYAEDVSDRFTATYKRLFGKTIRTVKMVPFSEFQAAAPQYVLGKNELLEDNTNCVVVSYQNGSGERMAPLACGVPGGHLDPHYQEHPYRSKYLDVATSKPDFDTPQTR